MNKMNDKPANASMAEMPGIREPPLSVPQIISPRRVSKLHLPYQQVPMSGIKVPAVRSRSSPWLRGAQSGSRIGVNLRLPRSPKCRTGETGGHQDVHCGKDALKDRVGHH